MKFSAVYIKSGKWYSAFIPELTGINSQGRSLEAAKKNLQEAVKDYCTANRKLNLRHIVDGQKEDVIRELFAI